MEEPKARSKLDPLPDSSDKEFWGDAEINTNLTPQTVFKTNEHFFIRKSGHEAECEHCHWGFALDPGDRIREGHLFDRLGKLVI